MKGRRKAAALFGAAVVLAGLIGLAYPAVGSAINRRAQGRVVREYRQETEELVDDEDERLLAAARDYNQWLYSRSAIYDLSEEETGQYNEQLAMSVTGIMGYLEIPAIDVSLPIYHGTEEAVLQVGVGHLAGSSLPIGGENTHAVLTGHSGLPSARLFTDLDQLQEGDVFTVTVLGQTAAYAVEDIQVVLPEEAELTFREGEDLCTLVTCVPLGVNTHRLLVTGSRTETPEPSPSPAPDEPGEESGAERRPPTILICATVAAAVLLCVWLVRQRDRKG